MKVSTNIKTYVKYKVDEFANTVLEDLKDQNQALYEELVKHDETVRKLFSEEQDKFRTNLLQRLSTELPSESIFASDEYRRDEVCSIPLVDLINRLTANQLPIVTNDNYISICKAIHDLQLVKSHTVNEILVGLELETIDPKDIDKEISLSFDGYDEYKEA